MKLKHLKLLKRFFIILSSVILPVLGALLVLSVSVALKITDSEDAQMEY